MSVNDPANYVQVPTDLVFAQVSPQAFTLACWLIATAEAGSRFYSQDEMAAEMQCGRGKVTRCLRELSEHGWLQVNYTPGERREYVIRDAAAVQR